VHCERRIISGELHYPRIPPEYWQARLAMARAMGLNAVSTYMFWNCHEQRPGTFDFTGPYDVAAFIRLAQTQELDVIVRPGPYVCAEWEYGGLPAWLLKNGKLAVRSLDERYTDPVRRWLFRLGEELHPYLRSRGGPIVAVQLENEYGAYGSDTAYLLWLQETLREAGFTGVPFYTIDQPSDLARGSLSALPIAVTFAPGDPGVQFEVLRKLRPDGPLLCGEYWAGWFDHWGEPHARLDDALQTADLDWMLAAGVSVNIYMFHGGTNFGFWNGANAFEPSPYQPTTTSYDYQAALDEAGRPTQKYAAFRECITRNTGNAPPAVPATPELIGFAPFSLDRYAPLPDLLGPSVESERLMTMEELDQAFGFILYRMSVDARARTLLHIEGVRDYATIMLDGRTVAHLDRRLNETDALLPAGSQNATLDILVENCGQINYGPAFSDDCKGIIGEVSIDGRTPARWKIFSLAFDTFPDVPWRRERTRGPALYGGTLHLETPGDAFFDVTDIGKGVLWINGRNAGRCWNIGPQTCLYVPGVWLRPGDNDVAVFDVFDRAESPRIAAGWSATVPMRAQSSTKPYRAE
jgi:beta-galactosidase